MRIVKMKDVAIGHRDDAVLFRAPVGDRVRTLFLDPADAVQMANQIATAAVRILDRPAPASMGTVGIHLLPYDGSGQAHLAVLTAEHGPFVMRVGPDELRALATAAEAALELAVPSGQA